MALAPWHGHALTHDQAQLPRMLRYFARRAWPEADLDVLDARLQAVLDNIAPGQYVFEHPFTAEGAGGPGAGRDLAAVARAFAATRMASVGAASVAATAMPPAPSGVVAPATPPGLSAGAASTPGGLGRISPPEAWRLQPRFADDILRMPGFPWHVGCVARLSEIAEVRDPDTGRPYMLLSWLRWLNDSNDDIVTVTTRVTDQFAIIGPR